MNNKFHDNLTEELKLAGASGAEAHKLSTLAGSIKHLQATKQPKPKPQNIWKKFAPFGAVSIVGIVVGMTLVIFSQTVLPGSLLYPVQKISDNVATSINPNYRGTVMMKRAQEVKQLVADRANQHLVLATLDSYKAEALAYRSGSSNYAEFEYCKTYLQQAAVLATNSEKQAINDSLNSLQNV